MSSDFAAAIRASGQLDPAPWFRERTEQSVEEFRSALEGELAAGEQVRLAAAVMVVRSGTHSGVLAVVPSRFLLCWAEGPRQISESYTLQSVPAETTTAAVDGIAGDASLLVLADRRIVLPSPAAAEQLRAAFTAGGTTAFRPAEAPTETLPPYTAGAGPATQPLPTVPTAAVTPAAVSASVPPAASPPAGRPPTPTPTGPTAALQSPAPSGAGPSGRRVAIIVAASVVALLLLGGAAIGIYRATQAAGPATGAGGSSSPLDPTGTGSTAPSTEPPPGEASLPQSAEPLGDDTLVVRRNDGRDWKIETLNVDGTPGTPLATGQSNRAAALTPDRRTVLFLRAAGDTATLRAVAADGSKGWALFSDGTKACPKLAQPAISRDNLLAIACSRNLNLLNLDGSLIRVLDRGRIGDPTFTSDGSAVVYWKAEGTDGDGGALYRVPVDGSEEPTLIASADDGPIDDPICSPTEDLIAASRLRDGERRIVTVGSTGDGSDLTELTPEDTTATAPGWSPDGSRIAYRVGTGEDSSLAVMNADGSEATEILPSQDYLAAPLWSAH